MERLVDVVRDVGGIHAQVMGSAELQLAARVAGITQEHVRAALWMWRELAKSWTLRGTLHLHPADELRLWTAARRAVVGACRSATPIRSRTSMPSSRRSARRFAASACRARSSRTRSRRAWARGRVSSWPPAGAISWATPRSSTGSASGRRRARRSRSCIPRTGSERSPRSSRTRRCARSLGATSPPTGLSTHREFRQWFTSRSFGPEAAAAVFAELDLVEVDVDGHVAYLLEDEKPMPRASSVRLLPEYDVYVMGFRERDELVPPAVREQVAAHGKGRYEGPAGTPFLLIDGVCAGIWSRKKSAKKIELTVEPARKLSTAGEGRRGGRGRADRRVPRPRARPDARLTTTIGAAAGALRITEFDFSSFSQPSLVCFSP